MVPETTTLEEAQAIMAKHQLQSLPLIDKDGKLVCLPVQHTSFPVQPHPL